MINHSVYKPIEVIKFKNALNERKRKGTQNILTILLSPSRYLYIWSYKQLSHGNVKSIKKVTHVLFHSIIVYICTKFHTDSLSYFVVIE